jgi:LuxR family maltose regulon positive regulatory protein
MQPAAGEAPLVATKLFVPRLRQNRVDRGRLRERLEESRHAVLVCAPAGSGKSTLLADWATVTEERVAWVSLETLDDEPRRFVNYVLASLRHVHATSWSEMLDAARVASPEMLEPVLVELLNSVAAGTRGVTLVLDDYHVIESDKVHSILQFLLDHLPPNLRIIIATRADPPLALSRLRARDMLTEIRAADLRFSMEEAEKFLNGSMGLHLEGKDVAELERRTEGWAVGLQMAAISLRGRDGTDAFIAGFTGSNRYVLDYLTDEVVSRQPGEVRQFLIETSILDRLNASLCNAVTGRSDSERMLQLLDSSNLFLISLDDRRYWYRYHHLFSTLLQHQLERSVDAAGIARLHQRASDWYEANGSPDAAMNHALAGRDLDRARAIVLEHALSRLLKADSLSVERWLAALPPEDLQNRVEFLVFQAIVGVLAFRMDKADAFVSRAEQLMTDSVSAEMRAVAYTVRGTTLRTFRRVDEAMEMYERALKLVDPTSRWYGIVAFEFGQNALAKNDVVGAENALAQALPRDRIPERSIAAILTQSILATARLLRGFPEQAVSLSRDAIRWVETWDAADQSGMALAAFPHAVLADIYLRWNDLDAARAYADRGIDYGKRGFFIGMFECTKARMHVAVAENDWEVVGRLTDEILHNVRATSHAAWTAVMQWLVHAAVFRRGQRTGSRSDIESVVQALERAELLNPPYRVRERTLPTFYACDAFLLAARVLLMQGRKAEALALLEEILEFAWSHDYGHTVMEVLVLRSLAQEGSKAVTTMQEALELASRSRYLRPFLDEAPVAVPLVERAAARIGDRDFATRVLSALNVPAQLSPGDGTLSDREVEVLRMIAAGISNQDAGRKLFISPATVKKHLENIYAKLGVGGRVQAIARAREMNLL